MNTSKRFLAFEKYSASINLNQNNLLKIYFIEITVACANVVSGKIILYSILNCWGSCLIKFHLFSDQLRTKRTSPFVKQRNKQLIILSHQ